MSRYELRLASREDDAALRELLASSVMDGGLAVKFAREPSYFDATEVDGHIVQVVTVYDREQRRLIGMGSRAVQRLFVDGESLDIGYLSGLRLLPEYHGRAGIFFRGYRYFRELHDDGRVPYYLTTIAEENTSALKLLTSGRKGLPTYSPLGRYHTLAVGPKRANRNPKRKRGANTGSRAPSLTLRVMSSSAASTSEVRVATGSDLENVIRFLHEHGSQRQFFPDYHQQDFTDEQGVLRGLKFDSLLLAFRNDQLVGTLALWDQRSFKQTSICSYPVGLRLSRRVYNGLARLRSHPRLPAVGETMNSRYVSLFVVAESDERVARGLIAAAREQLAGQQGELLLFGLHERDPLLPLVRTEAGQDYVTRVFLVHWEDVSPDLNVLSTRVPYLEVGRL